MKESELKRAVEDFLQYEMNAGKLYFDRLNSGNLISLKGKKPYRIKLCREGTADFMVIRLKQFQFSHKIRPEEDSEATAWFPHCGVIFLELKGEKGKQRHEQKEFQSLVEAQGADYFIIRSIEELEDIL